MQKREAGAEWLRYRNAVHVFIEALESLRSHVGKDKSYHIAYYRAEKTQASEPLAK